MTALKTQQNVPWFTSSATILSTGSPPIHRSFYLISNLYLIIKIWTEKPFNISSFKIFLFRPVFLKFSTIDILGQIILLFLEAVLALQFNIPGLYQPDATNISCPIWQLKCLHTLPNILRDSIISVNNHWFRQWSGREMFSQSYFPHKNFKTSCF